MRIVRVLVYEGPEALVHDHLRSGNLYLQEGQTKTTGQLGIREVFRGQLAEAGKVFFMEEPQVSEDSQDDVVRWFDGEGEPKSEKVMGEELLPE